MILFLAHGAINEKSGECYSLRGNGDLFCLIKVVVLSPSC